MRILIVGALSNYAIERYYLKYFNAHAGVESEIFAAQNIFLEYYHKNFINKLIFQFVGNKSIYKSINICLKEEEVEIKKPNILFVFKGMEVLPETLIWAKNKGIAVVNYNPDNPFVFTGLGSGNKTSVIPSSCTIYILLTTKKFSSD